MAPPFRLVLLRVFFVLDPEKTSWSSGGSSLVNERPFIVSLLSPDGNKQTKSPAVSSFAAALVLTQTYLVDQEVQQIYGSLDFRE